MQGAAADSLSSLSDSHRGKGLLPRILTAVVLAVSLHAVLLLSNGTGATSTTLQSQSLAVRFIESSVHREATPALEPSVALSMPIISRPEAEPRSTSEVAPAMASTGKPTRPQQATERTTATANAQPSGPPATTSPPSPSERPRSSLADASDYWLVNLLSVGPRPLGDIEPAYPDGADQRSGKVVLRVLISETGHVDDVAVLRASPPELFDASAVEAFSKARFSPGLAGGVAVKSQITVEVEFVPLNRLSRISGRSY